MLLRRKTVNICSIILALTSAHVQASESFDQARMAVIARNLPLLLKILETEPNVVNEKGEHGQTLLDTAVNQANPASEQSDSNIIDALLQYGSNINAQDDKGQTPLMRAAMDTNNYRAELLLAAGADPAIKTPMNETAMTIAQANGADENFIKLLQDFTTRPVNGALRSLRGAILEKRPKAVALLLRNNPTLVNAQDDKGQTPLLFAAYSAQDVGIVKLLLKAGADINITRKDGKTAYDLILKHPNPQPQLKEIIDLLKASRETKVSSSAAHEPATPATAMAIGNELVLLSNQLTALAGQIK
jgi:ankyrin repeat protein